MAYTYVNWKNNSPLLAASFRQMEENVEEIKNLLEPAPRGLIAIASENEDIISSKTVNTWVPWTRLNLDTIYIAPNRMTLVRAGFWGARTPSSFISPEVAIRILIDDVQFARSSGQIQGSRWRSLDGPVRLTNLAEGYHSFKVEVAVISKPAGQAEAAGTFMGHVNGIAQLSVEDRGEYIAPTNV